MGASIAKSRRWRRLWGAGALVLLVSAAVFLGWRERCRSVLDAEVDAIHARGEPVWWHEMEPEPIDTDDDGTGLFLAAIANRRPVTMSFVDLLDSKPAVADYPEFRAALEANRPALDLLAKAIAKPRCRLPYDYQTDDPYGIILENVQNWRELARLPRADVIHSLATGEEHRAVRAVYEALAIGELLREDPFLVSQLVRCAVADEALETLAIALAHTDLDPDAFRLIDGQLAAMRREFSLQPAMQSDRAMRASSIHTFGNNSELIDDFVKGNLDADPFFGLPIDRPSPLARVYSVPKWFFRSPLYEPKRMLDEAYLLRSATKFLPLIDQTGPRAFEKIANTEAQFAEESRSFPITRLISPTASEFHRVGVLHRQRLDMARLALRVARYRAEHGFLPPSLEVVTDEALATVPVCLFSDQPLIYQPTDKGFRIFPPSIPLLPDAGDKVRHRLETDCLFEVIDD